MRFACNLKVLLFADVKIKTCSINFTITIFCSGHLVAFIKLKVKVKGHPATGLGGPRGSG